MTRAVLGRAVAMLALLAGAVTGLACDVNTYCLTCERATDGGPGDGADAALDDGGAPPDACVPTGGEVCDGADNDCNGAIDDGALPGVGEACTAPPALNSGLGECAGGVKQCDGGAIVCSKPARPEVCDALDNNCDGAIDEGDPGGGTACGTNQGECVAGVNRCQGGALACLGAIGPTPGELCNSRDDDCDGAFDEGVAGLGPCVAGVDGPAEGDTGACELGARACVGGVVVCQGAVFPMFEQCDAAGLDQDCDGRPSNGYDLATDPQNCGACARACDLPRAFEGCAGGQCTIVACEAGYHDVNGALADGCELGPCTITGNEACDGADNDCDGLVDAADPDLVAPAGLCDRDGACATGTSLTCDPGGGGWRCVYGNPNVQTDAAGNIVPETRCDGDVVAGAQADNDCDGQIDEGQPTLGAACDNGELGACRATGAFACDAADRTGPAVCVLTAPGAAPAAERCDGLDNDCDGAIDDGAATGDLPDQAWVTIPGLTPAVQIMKYEASRPDALAGDALQTHACSAAGRPPWTNVTHPQAEAACAAIGARLCSEAEWQQMCMPVVTYPVAGPATTGTSDFVFVEAEDALANTTLGGAARAWTRIAPASFHGRTAMQVPDTGFEVAAATSALAQSSRLDFRLDLLASTAYRVWIRMRAPSPLGDTTPVAVTTSPVAPATTLPGDLVVVTTWTTSTNNVPAHALQAGFTQLLTQPLDDGANDARLSVAYATATAAGAQAYAPYAVSGGTAAVTYSTITVFHAGAIDVANIAVASASSTTNGAVPNPPTAGAFPARGAALAIGAWHLPAALAVGATAPASYAELGELAGAGAGELATAVRIGAAATSGDPGAFGDDTASVNGVAAATVILPFTTTSAHAVWTGLTAGTTAGAANAGDVRLAIDDQWQWVVSPALTSGAAGAHTFSLYTRHDGVQIDTIAVSRQATFSPTFDDAWAYATSPRAAQPLTCNADDLDTDAAAAGDQDGVLPAGSLAACHADQGAHDAFDLSGNVKEWTARRSPGQNPLRGGAANNEVSGTTCQLNFTLADDAFLFPNVGFRCCR